MNRETQHNREREHGAIIMEATLSLSIFMFAMFTLLSLIQIAYVQSRMSVALTCATKQIAEYAHVYFATGLNETFNESGGESSKLFGEVGGFLEELGGSLGSINSELGSFVTGSGTAMSATSLAGLAKNGLGEALVQQMMKTNLGDGSAGAADAFLRKYHVEDLSLLPSSFLAGSENHIYFRIKYKIKVVDLLNLDYSFNMSTWAYADAWSGK